MESIADLRRQTISNLDALSVEIIIYLKDRKEKYSKK